MEDKLHAGNGSVLIEMRHDNWPLIISFAGLGDQFQFKNILSSFNVNVIYLRDLKHNWYLNGVPNVGESVEEITAFLKNYISNSSFPKVITIGASAGGFAALLYGSLINANVIMALSPQTFVDPFNRFLYWDRRWRDRMKQIYTGSKSNVFFDIKPLISNFLGSINVFYDKRHRLDRSHVTRLRNPNIKFFASNIGGHTLAKHLKDNGMLKEYINDIINK